MQYSKLVAGAEYLAAGNTKWREGYAFNQARVRLVGTERYADNRYTNTYEPSPRGDYVQVVGLDPETGEPRSGPLWRKIRDLRGPWAEARAEQLAAIKAARDARVATSVAREEARKTAEELAAQAMALGLKASVSYSGAGSGDRHWFHVAGPDLRAWIDRMHAEGYDQGQS